MTAHIEKSIYLTEKITAKAEQALSGLELEMVMMKWPADFRAIMWEAVSTIASQRAAAAKRPNEATNHAEMIGRLTAENAALREALTLAEDVLSRAPFSTGIWPNGMHPHGGINKIRNALSYGHQQRTQGG